MAKTILIVDDDGNSRRIVAGLNKRLGYEILEAEGSEEAAAAALSEGPDLIVACVELPRMNGIELTIRLKQNPKTSFIPVILYSGRSDLTTAAVKAGATAFLSKPITFKLLKKAIDGALKTES
ncbi:MAG TPA: response regulator [Candidatus Binatia bacterium]